MPELESIYRPIQNDLNKVESMLAVIARQIDSDLAEALSDALSPKGRRLRPALLILSSRLGSGRADVSRLAAAVELVHSAALLHDDLVDHAETRRGSVAASRRLGHSGALVLGNYLYSKAFELMPNSNGLRQQLSAATSMMCSGEAHELARRGDLKTGLGDYIQMAGKKTASLTSACCSIGAVSGCADSEVCCSLAAYGLLLGLAYQIRDDCLDLRCEKGTTGKSCYKDFAERNATLPLTVALPSMNEKEKRRASSMFKGREKMDTTWLVETLERYDGIQKSMALAEEFSRRAAMSLEAIPDSETKESLRLLTAYCVERNS